MKVAEQAELFVVAVSAVPTASVAIEVKRPKGGKLAWVQEARTTARVGFSAQSEADAYKLWLASYSGLGDANQGLFVTFDDQAWHKALLAGERGEAYVHCAGAKVNNPLRFGPAKK